MKTLAKLVLSSLVLAGGTWGAVAQAAEATGSVNVRSGPGTGYVVVDTLSAGENVDIDRCVGSGWCYVLKSGPDGWVSARYLSDTDGFDGGLEPRPQPDVSVSFSIEGFSFSFGDGGFSVGPSRPGSAARACFFEDRNYHGDRFCMRSGESLRSLGNLNDEISSIDVSGGAEALVCEDVRFGGRCVVVSRDVRDLGQRGNDQVSSIKVR